MPYLNWVRVFQQFTWLCNDRWKVCATVMSCQVQDVIMSIISGERFDHVFFKYESIHEHGGTGCDLPRQLYERILMSHILQVCWRHCIFVCLQWGVNKAWFSMDKKGHLVEQQSCTRATTGNIGSIDKPPNSSLFGREGLYSHSHSDQLWLRLTFVLSPSLSLEAGSLHLKLSWDSD
mgnify:FL=1